MIGGWARYALERYEILKKWRVWAELVAKACLEVLGGECRGVYVVGGAAEDRLTVLSDIDVVIVVDNAKHASLDTILAVKKKASELGLSDEVPLDLKILVQEEFTRLTGKVYKKAVRIL